ncbi:hypothetical protein EV138_5620 [Kribbella voronezhensis]|uniref:Uncharacterized protein n=1 Tax=Kribbella voronezhensis TaxID=2512212 RepID=A0A4R7SV36_9ACTN|nr:hypothetical protein [Kribbella voronezhensis]TDU83160.1 hypothetical protein EV138_5620 [Kribbella voronezhensis]
MRSVVPYPTLFGEIDFEVVAVAVDGADLPYGKISRAERAVAMHQTGRTEWDTAVLRLKAVLPDDEIADGPWESIVCLAILAERATNVRSTAFLTHDADGSWRGMIDLSHARHLQRATLSLAVVGKVEGIGGRLIGATDKDWVVDLEAAAPLRQGAIEIVQVDFVESADEWLRPFKESAWIVETSGEIPTVYINTTAVDGLVAVLNGNSTQPAERLLREATASQIAQDVWTAMFHTAIGDFEFDEDGTPQMPTGWRERVLRVMLPDILPNRQLSDALYEIHERRTKGFGWAELQTNIQHAAGRRSQVTKKLTNAIRSVARGEAREAR